MHRRLTNVVALGATLAAIGSLWPTRSSRPSGRHESVPLIQEAVLRDLLEDETTGLAERRSPSLRHRVVCVSTWSTKEVFVAAAERDPSPRIVAGLRGVGRPIVPISSCISTEDGYFVGDPPTRAGVVGVAAPQWVSDDFVRVQGAWYVGPFFASGYRYTVSYAKRSWHVDTVTFLWIS
jgi:hypothetical protein